EDDFYGAITIYAIDIDDDGDTDILGGAWYSHEVAWWRNDGGDPVVWTKFTIGENYYQCHEVYAVDFDGDNDIDVLAASTWNNEIAWWRNDGGDPVVWTKFTICDSCESIRTVYAADIDGDDDLDVLGGCFGANKVIWMRNDGGDPIEWTEFDVSTSFAGCHKVLAHDMDDDGDNDVLGAGYMAGQMAWWESNGDEPIEWTHHIIDGNYYGALMLYPADIDNDDDWDVIGTGDQVDDVTWWRNDGGYPFYWGQFTIDYFYEGAWPCYPGDIDGDGDIDILSGSDVITRLSWWENDLYAGIEDKQKPLPEALEITGNYPNPFNARTIIEFSLPTSSEVTLDIYNILGSKAASIFSNKLPAGNHQVVWDAKDMPSGVYFARLHAGDQSTARKMILMK
ncbi:MAG: T9SS type A sorting domain-containing protein, partial [candidate division Zixibacteria bacterium]|nr:T9SS type A sorting domain-containing protein [candidate division Zixibacteria bacterium]